MVHGVAVVWLPVGDIERAASFYEQTLGLKLLDRQEQWASLEANGLRIGLNAREDASAPAQGGGAVLAFQPDGELEAAVSELRDAGVEFVGGISEHPWGRIAAFHDPDGNSLQLFSAPS